MKRTILLLAVLAVTLGILGYQAVDRAAGPSAADPPAAAVETPLASNPRFASLINPPPQEDQGGPLPSFVVTDYVETKTADAWEISGTIQQSGPAVPGLNFDCLIVVFEYTDGRDCEWRIADHGNLRGLEGPVSFVLRLQAASYVDSGFGFANFADFQDNAQVSAVVVQSNRARYYVKSGGKYIARFVIPIEAGAK